MDSLSIQLEPLRAFLVQIGAYMPRVLLALAVLLAAWLVAKVVRYTVVRGLHAINFQVLTERSGMDNFLRQGGMAVDASAVFAALAYWLVILVGLTVAINALGLTYVADLVGRVLWFIPNVFVALLVLAFGSYFAKFLGDAMTGYGRSERMQDAPLLGKVVQGAILLFVMLIALDQVKIGGDIVRQSFLIILAGVVFALALAFGLAGKDWAAERIEEWWPRGGTGRARGRARMPERMPEHMPDAAPEAAAAHVPPQEQPARGDAPPAWRPTPVGAWPSRTAAQPQERAHP